MLRFFEGLPPRTIAKRLDLPVATVRTQLQRAVEKLRVALDARSEGARERWLHALAPFAFEATVSVPATLLAAAAVVLLLVGGVWWRIRVEPDAVGSEPLIAVASGAPEAGDAIAEALPGLLAAMRDVPAPPSGARVVTGRVVDALGRPIEGATVELYDDWRCDLEGAVPQTVMTGADGNYSFDDAVRGTSVVILRKQGFTSARRKLTLDAMTTSERGVTTALFAARSVAGVVRDEARVAIAGARVLAFDETLFDQWRWPEATSDVEGRFALDGVPECRAWIDVVAPGFAKRRLGPIAMGDGSVDVILTAEPRAVLDLRVFDAAGAPLRDGRLAFTLEGTKDSEFSCFRLPRSLEGSAIPADGHLITHGLPSGDYRFQVWSSSSRFQPHDFRVTLVPGETAVAEQRAVFTAGDLRLRGILRDPAGVALAGRVIAVAPSCWSAVLARATSADDGAFDVAAPVAAGR